MGNRSNEQEQQNDRDAEDPIGPLRRRRIEGFCGLAGLSRLALDVVEIGHRDPDLTAGFVVCHARNMGKSGRSVKPPHGIQDDGPVASGTMERHISFSFRNFAFFSA